MIQKTVAVKYAVPEDLNFYNSDSIENIHLMYLNAGCDIVTTNSFGANPIKLEHAAHSAEEYITKAVQIAHAAVKKHEAGISQTGAEKAALHRMGLGADRKTHGTDGKSYL